MKIIGIEEHIDEEGFNNIEERLKDMDEAGIEMQVLSFLSPYEKDPKTSISTSTAKGINNELSRVVEKHPARFASFATLALQDPDAAAEELDRAVKQLGLKGALIPSGQGGGYLDNVKYEPILETAEKLDVPICIHPGIMSPDMSKLYLDCPDLAGPIWGFAAEVGLHAMRLIFNGVFNKYPRLKIILGHLGEGIPYWLWRMDNHWSKLRLSETGLLNREIKKKPSQYFADNFYVTTSGMFWQPALQLVHSALAADRILFAVDYPPESSVEAVQFIESMPLSNSDKEKICHLNAEALLRL